MSADFRSEVFKLCKKVQKDESAQMIGKIIHDMSVIVEKKTGETIKDARSDFAYLAKHSNSEFHGFLFLDENIDKIKLPEFYKPSALLPDDRALMERGHKTLIRFIELCLSDIANDSKNVAESISPYYLYKDVSVPANAEALLSDDDMQPDGQPRLLRAMSAAVCAPGVLTIMVVEVTIPCSMAWRMPNVTPSVSPKSSALTISFISAPASSAGSRRSGR